ncbi:MAG: DUF3300 domain-containing protein [Proteobacteria bacterium]|nr:DUF3300 domain-containing protein [Pseudomonadota bacterium]
MLLSLALLPLISCAQDATLAQNYQTAPPTYQAPVYAAQPTAYGNVGPEAGQFLAPPQLADLVARIALYPDDLIGIILPASTYPLQVVQAARYLDAVRSNSTLAPDDSWDNSVVALLNYPDVVNMMNHDLEWTERLGQAVIMQQADVISAIGQFRAQAQAAGNLRSDGRQVVEMDQGAIRIRPANPQVIYVPQYEPTRVIVYQSEPVLRYYPRPCPVYHYNYSSRYPSGFSNFWGVSTLFTIGWSSRRVHLHDYDFYDDPRYDRPHDGRFYRRSHHGWHGNDDHDRDGDRRWRDDDRRDGRDVVGPSRPPRERDWQPRDGRRPRPMRVGAGGQGRDDDRRGSGAGRDGGRPGAIPLVPPTRGVGGRDAQPLGDPPQDRRFSRPMPPRENLVRPADPPPASRFSSPRSPVPSREAAPRRGDPPQDTRFSRPMSPRNEQAIERRPSPAPTTVGPTRMQRDNDNGRGSVRQVAPSRGDSPNMSPSRHFQISPPPARNTSGRQDSRSSQGSRAGGRDDNRAATVRQSGGRDDDGGRGRGNRDR